MTYFYSKWAVIVMVSETVDQKFEVSLLNTDTHRRIAEKEFNRGADPSKWIGEQMAKYLPTWIADLHRVKNDDWRGEETIDPPIRENDGDRYFDSYCNDDWWIR